MNDVAMSDAASALARPGVLFVGGWGRSGSTLLDRMLGQLDGAVSVGELRELWFRGGIEDRLCGCGAPFSRCEFWRAVGDEAFGGWDPAFVRLMSEEGRAIDRVYRVGGLLRPEVAPRVVTYADRLGTLYDAIASVSGATTVVDSSKLANYAALLEHVDGLDVRMVHLVRDSRGVILSWQKRVRRPDRSTADAGTSEPGSTPDDDMERYGLLGATARYLGYNTLAQLVGARCEGRMRVRYEDLVIDPRRVITAIAEFAGLPTDDDALAWLGDSEAALDVSHTVDGNPMRMVRGPVRLRVDDAWRSELSATRRVAVSAVTLPLLLEYGYVSATPRCGSGRASGRAWGRAS